MTIATVKNFVNSAISAIQSKASTQIKSVPDVPSITQYIRNSRTGQLKGCLVALKIDGTVKVGWSLCNSRDAFDKKISKALAFDRAATVGRKGPTGVGRIIPNSIATDVQQFVGRAAKYFRIDKSLVACDTAVAPTTVLNTILIQTARGNVEIDKSTLGRDYTTVPNSDGSNVLVGI